MLTLFCRHLLKGLKFNIEIGLQTIIERLKAQYSPCFEDLELWILEIFEEGTFEEFMGNLFEVVFKTFGADVGLGIEVNL